MANSFQVVDWLTMEPLRLLKNRLQAAQFANTDYNGEFTKPFAVGETVRVPIPQQWTVTEGLPYNPQPINRLFKTVTVDQVFGIHFELDSVEQALESVRGREKIKNEIMDPAMTQIAQEIDSRFALFVMNHANNIVGTLGTDPTSFQIFNEARQRLVELACPPQGKKGAVIAPAINTSLVPAAASYFQPPDAISKQYKDGAIGRYAGFDFYESMSIWSHTAGTWAGAVSVTTTLTDGATSMVVTATTGDTFKKGDVIGIGGRYAVNPSTRRRTNSAKTMTVVVQEDATAAGGSATLSFLPALYGPGSQYQNIDVLPTAADVLTLFPGTSSPNGKSGVNSLIIHRDAAALVGVKMEVPRAAEMASQTRDPDTGISVRFIRMFDPIQSKMVNRFDVLLGFGSLYGHNCAVRVLGA